MTINSFFIPTDKDIYRDVKENQRSIKFTNEGFLSQNIDKTTYFRNYTSRFDAEKKEYMVSYIKNGLTWQFEGTTSVKSRNLQL